MNQIITRQKICKTDPERYPIEIVTEPMTFGQALPALMALRTTERKGGQWAGYAHVMKPVKP